MSKVKHIFTVFCFLLFSQTQAQVKVNAVLDSSKIRIGEQTKLDVYVTWDVNAQKSLSVEWPKFEDTITGKVEIVSKTAIDSTIPDKNNPGIIQQHQQFIVSAYDSGYFVIPPFKFVVNGDTANPVLTEPLFLTVNTVPTDTTDASVKDIKPPFDEPFDWKWYLPYVYWGAGAVAIIAILTFIIIKLTRKKPEEEVERKPDVPPHILALQQLEKVKMEAIWKEGKTKEYYSAISDSVRLYIEGRFGIQALELTTDEIVRAFKSQVIDPMSKEKLQQMLVLSDFVKFAKQIPIEQEHEMALQNAFDFVNGTKREDEIVLEDDALSTQPGTTPPVNTASTVTVPVKETRPEQKPANDSSNNKPAIENESSEKPKSKKLKYLGIVLGSLIGLAAIFGAISLFFPSVDKQLNKFANEFNKSCPMMIDGETRLDNVEIPESKTIQYNYTLVQRTKAEVDADVLKAQLEPNIINVIRTNPQLKPLTVLNVVMQYIYKDKNGEIILKLTINPEDYKE